MSASRSTRYTQAHSSRGSASSMRGSVLPDPSADSTSQRSSPESLQLGPSDVSTAASVEADRHLQIPPRTRSKRAGSDAGSKRGSDASKRGSDAGSKRAGSDAGSSRHTSSEEHDEIRDSMHSGAPRSSIQLLGELARHATDSITNLWPVTESPGEPPEEEGHSSDSEKSEVADLHTGAKEDASGFKLDDFASSVRRATGDMFGLWPGAGAHEEPSSPRYTSGNSSSSRAGNLPRPSAAERAGIDFDEMRKEVRRPFQRLLAEIPEAGTEAEAFLPTRVFARAGLEDDEDCDTRSPLLSAVARSRLIGRVLGCCDAVMCELSQEEVHLWDTFLRADVSLHGALYVGGDAMRQVLSGLSRSPDRIATWLEAINEWADDNHEVDFADLLDWFAGEQQKSNIWAFQTSLRSSFSQLLSTNPDVAMRMRPELVTQLRNRLASMTPRALGKAAAACQRTLVLTSWCQCERRLFNLITPALLASASAVEVRGPPPGLTSALVAVLRGINAELAPTERVLWELLGTNDANFDGSIDKQEVLAAIGQLLIYSMERELGTPEAEFEELQSLRADCRRRSVESLFEDANNQRQRTVTLADVLRWWWDMSEEYRVAAGLSIPAFLLRKSLHRRPEEMFKDKLPRMAANPACAKIALKGHARVLAELRALAVSRALENLTGRGSPTDTLTTTSCTSEVTLASDVEDEEEEHSACAAPNDDDDRSSATVVRFDDRCISRGEQEAQTKANGFSGAEAAGGPDTNGTERTGGLDLDDLETFDV